MDDDKIMIGGAPYPKHLDTPFKRARANLDLLDPCASPMSWEYLQEFIAHYEQADPDFNLKPNPNL